MPPGRSPGPRGSASTPAAPARASRPTSSPSGLRGYSRFIVDCGGDIRIGGADALVSPYEVFVEHPLTGERAYVLKLGSGAVATSGLNVRIWRGDDGRYAHHLLDPSTGEPAWTGLIGATALGDTAVEAETFAKAALLSGPEGGRADARRARRPARPRQRPDRDRRAARRHARASASRSSAAQSGRMNAAATTLQTHGWWLASRASGLRRPRPGDDLGRPRAGDGGKGDAPARALAQADGDPRAHRARRHHRDRRARHHPARRPLAATRARRHHRPLRDGLPPALRPASASSAATWRRCSGSASTPAGGSAPRLWRKAHRATIVVYLLGLVHAFGAGTDASTVWFRWWVLMTAPVIGGLFVYRVFAGGAKRARSRRREDDRAHEGAREHRPSLPAHARTAPRFPDPRCPRRHDGRPRSPDRRRRARRAALRRDPSPARVRGPGADGLRRARPAL